MLVTYNIAANKKTIYVDGEEQNSTTSQPYSPYNGPDPMSLGCLMGSQQFFQGQIDALSIYDYELSQTEVENLIYEELNGDEAGLVSYYNFNHGIADSTNTNELCLYDKSANNNIGILNNFALAGTESNWVSSYEFEIFTEVLQDDVPGMFKGGANWGDYDGDGNLDFAITGTENANHYSRIYTNEGNDSFSIQTTLRNQYVSSVVWGDFDNDNDLDIINSGSAESELYMNNGDGTFTDMNIGIPKHYWSDTPWGDFDNDGDLDFIIFGTRGTYDYRTTLYRNDRDITSSTGYSFTEVTTAIDSVTQGDADWGDYDNDGDLDLVLVGFKDTGNSGSNYAAIYRNDGPSDSSHVFTNINAGLLGVNVASAEWVDFDTDGDLDLVYAGSRTNSFTKFYRNDGNDTFVDISDSMDIFDGLGYGEICFADFDNDGDMDYCVTGEDHYSNPVPYSFLGVNDGTGIFTEIDYNFVDVYQSYNIWGDYDNDNDLDIMIIGRDSTGTKHTKLYRNDILNSNTPPEAPTNLSANISDDSITFSWNAATDTETPAIDLTYNLRVGTSSQGTDIITPQADPSTGKRYVVAYGPQFFNTSWTINTSLTGFQIPSTLYWSVQTIDNGYAGSEFATEATIDIGETLYPILLNADELTSSDVLCWETDSDDYLIGFQIQIDDNSDFSSPIVDDKQEYTSRSIISTEDIKYLQNNYRRETSKSKREKAGLNNKKEIDRDIYTFAGVALNELTGYDNLVENSSYYWRMRPIYNVVWTEAVLFTDGTDNFVYNTGNNAPNAPTDGFVPANDDPIATLTPIISWNNATDPDHSDYADLLKYIVELDTLNTFTTPVLTDTTAQGTTYIQVQSDLLEGYRYYYRIKTIDDENAESGWSTTQQFLTLMPPQNVTISRTDTETTLSWDAMPFDTRGTVYTIYSSDDPNKAFPESWIVEAVNLGTTTWQDIDSTSSKKFYKVTVGSEVRAISNKVKVEKNVK